MNSSTINYKGLLQEKLAKFAVFSSPRYSVRQVGEQAFLATVEVTKSDENGIIEGHSGDIPFRSKKEAEQAAARVLFENEEFQALCTKIDEENFSGRAYGSAIVDASNHKGVLKELLDKCFGGLITPLYESQVVCGNFGTRVVVEINGVKYSANSSGLFSNKKQSEQSAALALLESAAFKAVCTAAPVTVPCSPTLRLSSTATFGTVRHSPPSPLPQALPQAQAQQTRQEFPTHSPPRAVESESRSTTHSQSSTAPIPTNQQMLLGGFAVITFQVVSFLRSGSYILRNCPVITTTSRGIERAISLIKRSREYVMDEDKIDSPELIIALDVGGEDVTEIRSDQMSDLMKEYGSKNPETDVLSIVICKDWTAAAILWKWTENFGSLDVQIRGAWDIGLRPLPQRFIDALTTGRGVIPGIKDWKRTSWRIPVPPTFDRVSLFKWANIQWRAIVPVDTPNVDIDLSRIDELREQDSMDTDSSASLKIDLTEILFGAIRI